MTNSGYKGCAFRVNMSENLSPTGTASWVRGIVQYQNPLNNSSGYSVCGHIICYIGSSENMNEDIYYGFISGSNTNNLRIKWRHNWIESRRNRLTPLSPFRNQEDLWCLEYVECGTNIYYFNFNLICNQAMTKMQRYDIYRGSILNSINTNVSAAIFDSHHNCCGKVQYWISNGLDDRVLSFYPNMDINSGEYIYGSMLLIGY